MKGWKNTNERDRKEVFEFYFHFKSSNMVLYGDENELDGSEEDSGFRAIRSFPEWIVHGGSTNFRLFLNFCPLYSE